MQGVPLSAGFRYVAAGSHIIQACGPACTSRCVWAAVPVSQWNGRTLLVLMSFTIVTNLQHVKATVRGPAGSARAPCCHHRLLQREMTMATVREGGRAALVLVDAQVGVMAQAWQAQAAIACMAQAVQHARARGAPVLWVQHHSDELPRDSDVWQWVPQLVPAHGEVRIHKAHNSSFEQTGLDDELARLNVSHVVLAGAATNWCIRATAYAALERGYDLTLLSDAHSTESMTLDDGSVVDAATVVRDLNTTMTWLRYPGRRVQALPVAQLNLAMAAG